MSNQATNVSSVFDLPKKCYEIVRRNWKLYALVNALALLSGVLAIFDGGNDNQNSADSTDFVESLSNSGAPELAAIIGAGIIVFLLYAAATIFLYILSLSLQLRSSEIKQPYSDLILKDFKKYWFRLVLLHIVLAIIFVAGLILLIIPGLAALFFLCFSPYIMIDRDLGVVDSIKQSYELVKNNLSAVGAVFFLSIGILIIIAVVSAVPYLGLLAATVLSIIISPLFALRYVELRKNSKPAALKKTP